MAFICILVRRVAAMLVLISGTVFAQSGERVALVVGNASYPTSPLSNPKNDAQAMAALLGDAGFAVDLRVDTSLDALRQSVAQFGQKVMDSKVKFAVFYYAGHGVQLDWRNYIIPVSAKIRSAADVRSQTVDISELLKYMTESKNKNYVVILDACRDDPFGAAYRPPMKGLSQFNAPSGSVLAYSTAPGKVAFDGGGTNGLYTAYLLKEFAVKGVKIEDAFKRTRLNVRLASNGKQVPWETTSLEEDLYLFPVPAKRPSHEEQDALLEEELRAWAKVRNTTDFLELAEFIRKYPSGNVSELAAARMNRLLAQQQSRDQRVVSAKTESMREAEQRAALEEAMRVAGEARAERERQEAQRIEAAKAEQPPAPPVVVSQGPAPAASPSPLPAPEPPQAEQESAAAELVAETPFFAGSSANMRRYAVGDEFRFRVIDRYTKLERPLAMQVTAVQPVDDRVEFNGGEYVADMMGNILTNLVGSSSTPRQFYPAELVVGKRWTTRFKQARPDRAHTFTYDLKVVGKERITVPAGTFDTFKIEARGYNVGLNARIERNIWIAPGVNADIAHETTVRRSNGFVEQYDRQELVSLKQAAAVPSTSMAAR